MFFYVHQSCCHHSTHLGLFTSWRALWHDSGLTYNGTSCTLWDYNSHNRGELVSGHSVHSTTPEGRSGEIRLCVCLNQRWSCYRIYHFPHVPSPNLIVINANSRNIVCIIYLLPTPKCKARSQTAIAKGMSLKNGSKHFCRTVHIGMSQSQSQSQNGFDIFFAIAIVTSQSLSQLQSLYVNEP